MISAVCRIDFSRMAATPTSAMISTPGWMACKEAMPGVPFISR